MVAHSAHSALEGAPLARLFISYSHKEADYAFGLRQWLIDAQGWSPEDIFVDGGHLHAGEEWKPKLLAQAEAAEVLLLVASDASLDVASFCYKEVRAARGTVLAVTIKGVATDDARLLSAVPPNATARQIAALDQEPREPFGYVSPRDRTTGAALLNRTQVESIGATLRDLGVAPNSFTWAFNPAGPYPGLQPLDEGDEAIFCGRNLDIRDGIKALEELRASVTRRALLIHAPSGAGKSSFLRAGLWKRLRRHAAFTPLAIVRVDKGAIRNETWGFVTGLFHTLDRADRLKKVMSLSRGQLEDRIVGDLAGLLVEIAEADKSEAGRRTLLIGVDQAEEMTAQLAAEDEAELDRLLALVTHPPEGLDIRLVLTVRDDSTDATLARLGHAGITHEMIAKIRLDLMPPSRYREIIVGPAMAADKAGWPIKLGEQLTEGLQRAASAGDHADALPILALALQRMAAKERKTNGEITLLPAHAKAFVERSVEDAATEAREAARATVDDLRRLIIPQLANWDRHAGAAKRIVARADRLFKGGRAALKTLADEMVKMRLLTVTGTGREADDATLYEVAHEALLRIQPLASLIHERREKYVLADMLAIEARDWQLSGEFAGRLGRAGERLREGLELLEYEDFHAALPEGVAPYLAACAAKEKADKDYLRRLAGLAFVKPSEEANNRGEHEHALRLATAGALLAKDNFDQVPELWSPIALAIFNSRTKHVLREHTGPIKVFALSADGKRFVTGSSDNTACLWDVTTGARIAVFKAHSHCVWAAMFSPDGNRVVTGSQDNTARIWDATTGAEIAVLSAHSGLVRTVSFSPDGKSVVTGSFDNTARLWDAKTGAEIAVLSRHSGAVVRASFSADGTRVLTGSSDNTARLWDVATGAEIAVLKAHTDKVWAASFSPDGSRVLTGSSDATARIWDTGTGVKTADLMAHRGAVVSASFSPDGSRVLTCSTDGTARLWDAATGDKIAVEMAHTGSVWTASFSSDGKRIVTGSSDNTARIWDAETGIEIAALKAHADTVWAAALGLDDKLVVTGSEDNTARIWDAATSDQIAVLKSDSGWVNAASFSPDGKQVVTASRESAQLWDTETGAEIGVLKAHTDSVWDAAFSSDGTRLVTGSKDCTARIWDAKTRATIAVLVGHTSDVLAAQFSTDGRFVVTGSLDKTARLWDAATGDQITVLGSHRGGVLSVSFNSDGTRVVTGSDDHAARILDAATGAEIAVLQRHTNAVRAVSFNPDGTRVATGSYDKTARIWDAATGDEIAVLKAHTGGVWDVSFSPDGVHLVTGSTDGTARLWDAATGTEICVLDAHESTVGTVSFSPDGKSVLTGSSDKTAKIFDVSRTAAIKHGYALAMTAALTRGIGHCTPSEREDPLMKILTGDDLFAQALSQIGRTADDPQLQSMIADLLTTKHDHTYLSPTQFAEKFGMEVRGFDDDHDPNEAPAAGYATTVARSRAPISADDLIGQEFVETCRGVAIFRLTDGRYHVVNNFATATLDDARAAATERPVE